MSDHRLPETKGALPRNPIRKVNEEHQQSMSRGELLALAITDRVGTLGFFLTILAWTILWLGWNILAPASLKFDPPTGFVFWLFISNMIQILLMPLIMVGQNLQGRHAELLAESDYEVNVRAEEEIEHLVRRLDEQQALLEAILQKLGSNTAATKS